MYIHCCCLVTKSCLTLCDPMDYSPPGSSLHSSQARILEQVTGGFFSSEAPGVISDLEPGFLNFRVAFNTLARHVFVPENNREFEYFYISCECFVLSPKYSFKHKFQALSLCVFTNISQCFNALLWDRCKFMKQMRFVVGGCGEPSRFY